MMIQKIAFGALFVSLVISTSANAQVLIELTPSRPSLNPSRHAFKEQFHRKGYKQQQLIKIQEQEREQAEKFRRRKITEQAKQRDLQRKRAEDLGKRKETELVEQQEQERQLAEDSSTRKESDRVRERKQKKDLTTVEVQNLDVKVDVPVQVDVTVK